MDHSRQGQLAVAAGQGVGGLRDLRLPGYISELGPKYLVNMRKPTKNKTYAKVGGHQFSHGPALPSTALKVEVVSDPSRPLPPRPAPLGRPSPRT